MDDCADAFLLTIEHLTYSLNKFLFSRRTSFEVFNIASGNLISVRNLTDTLVAFSRSKSPIRRIPREDPTLIPHRADIERAWRILGFRPSVTIEAGLLQLVKAYLSWTEAFLRKRIESTCGDSSLTISINANIDKLNGCLVHIEVDIEGEYQALSPPKDEGEFWSSDTEVPPRPSRLYQSSEWTKNRQIYRIKPMHEWWWLGVMRAEPGPVELPKITTEDTYSNDPKPVVDWELEVNPDDHATIRLMVPDTDLYLISPTVVGGNFSIVSTKERNEWPFRISPICCKARGPWPLLRDDRRCFFFFSTCDDILELPH